ncbi:MAG: DUF2520 domain-containing protein [Bacteroidota bacterium]
MTFSKIKKIIIIGAGNVGTNLASAFHKQAVPIYQIFDIHLENALELATKVNSKGISDLSLLDKNADLYIISVPDDAISAIVDLLEIKENSFVVHTSGSTSMNVLKKKFENCGVLYPFQTFIKTDIVDFLNIPLCIEATNDEHLSYLKVLAEYLSSSINIIDSNKRRTIHLAAVFACNFVNYMYTISEQILSKENISFDIIKPLIMETAQKAQLFSPSKVQTGPAKRGDFNTINAHNSMLSASKEDAKVYSLLTQQIINFYTK